MKKEIIIPALIIFLGVIFVFINILVFFSKGNNKFIKKKLKVGAIILSLTGIIACGTPHTEQPTCYIDTLPDKYADSIAEQKKLDSIKSAQRQKQIDDSLAKAIDEKHKKDSIAKIKKKNPVRPVCYGPPKNTCYTQVKKN